ncbi:FAD-dependent oxidoreductase [Nocardia vinacea]|uniref:FAD-dependent oxidoreductase n=1 Tax=Nocardia vinacea TaxID=96468 RepID=A0ABZ1YNA7_9NOCA|nr:FAD-dependent oxidoreductase [Nocardia vinacea]
MTVSRRGRVAIVGTGIAGATAAETLRKEGFRGDIVMMGTDPDLPYRRPMVSKELLSGAAAAEKALLRSAPAWSDLSIDVRTATTVRAVDAPTARVEFDDGTDLGYDALILATGGRPRRLDPLLAGAHALRGMHDVGPLREILARAASGGGVPSLLIVGGGLVGMEVAASARALGAEVTVLEMADRVLEHVLPELVSAMFERMHRDRGVVVHTGVRLAVQIREPDGRTRVSAADGREWVADAVVVAVGMTPNDELAAQAGLTVDDGIVVDDLCATSAAGVYAVGDVARFPNRILGGAQRVEHWNHARDHGAAAARAVLGGTAPYEEVPWCWTTQFGRNVQMAGWPGLATEVLMRGDIDSGPFTVLCLRGDRLVGAVATGRPRDIQAARTLIKDGPYLPPESLAGDDFGLVELSAVPGRFTTSALTVASE